MRGLQGLLKICGGASAAAAPGAADLSKKEQKKLGKLQSKRAKHAARIAKLDAEIAKEQAAMAAVDADIAKLQGSAVTFASF